MRSRSAEPLPSFIVVDCETQSGKNLKTVGGHRYASDREAHAVCFVFGYCRHGAEFTLHEWVPPYEDGEENDPAFAPPDLPFDECILVAHNASFDKAFFDKHIWKTKWSQWRCTMARAAQLNLPMSLDTLGLTLNVGRKDPAGDELIRLHLSGTKKVDDGPLQEIIKYCKQDVRLTKAIFDKIGGLNLYEQRIWEWDQRVNARGFRVDHDFVMGVNEALKTTLHPIILEGYRAIVDPVARLLKPTQRKKLITWLADDLIFLDDTRKSTLEKIIETGQWEGMVLSEDVLFALQSVLDFGKSSLAKFRKFEDYMEDGDGSGDHRVRGCFVYFGAHTGRWAGRGPQPQNLTKQVSKKFAAVREMIVGVDLDAFAEPELRALYSELTACARPTILARPGYQICAIDFSAVEARILAWLADEFDVLDAFRRSDADKSVPDVYEMIASKIFAIPAQEIHDRRRAGDLAAIDMRNVGKAAVLGCGFGMSKKRFLAKSREDKSTASDEVLSLAHETFRTTRKKSCDLWSRYKRACELVMCDVDESVTVGRIKFDYRHESCIRVHLPSGRKLHYQHVQHDCECGPVKWCRCSGRDSGFRWSRDVARQSNKIDPKTGVKKIINARVVKQTGGHITTENIVQGISANLTSEAALRCEERVPEALCIMHAHDELIFEIPLDSPGTFAKLLSTIAETPTWAEGLPIAVEGWVGPRYGKG